VLDVAGGNGRHGVWLAVGGWRVTLVDISDVALELARARALEEGAELATVRRDLETDGLPEGGWDVVLIHHFLDRSVLAAAPLRLRRGGVLAFCQPTVRNLERHDRPGRRWLLEEGEMLRWLADRSDDLEVIEFEEGWLEEGRHEARLVAKMIGAGFDPHQP